MSTERPVGFDNFPNFIENGLVRDPRIVAVDKWKPEDFTVEGAVGYNFTYKAGELIGVFTIILKPDNNPGSEDYDEELGQNRLIFQAPLAKLELNLTQVEQYLVAELQDWQEMGGRYVYIEKYQDEKSKYIVLENPDEEFASDYTLKDIEDCIQEILDSAPKVLEKMRELGLIK